MPKQQNFGAGRLVRPLLKISRDEIRRYVNDNQIAYLEDPSNEDDSFDRNYLRRSVLPEIRRRWPSFDQKVSQATDHQRQLARIVDDNADAFIEQHAKQSRPEEIGQLPHELLRQMSEDERHWTLRRWIVRAGLSVPEQVHYAELDEHIFCEKPTSTACVSWKNAEIRCYDGFVYLAVRQPAIDPTLRFDVRLAGQIELPHGKLIVEEETAGQSATGLRCELAERDDISIRFYTKTGERCQPEFRGHSQTLKKLWQEWRVPPWNRQLTPLIYVGEEIAAVVPYCVTKEYASQKGEPNLRVRFVPYNG